VLMNMGVRLDDVRNEVVKLDAREPGAPDATDSDTWAPGGRGSRARALGRFVRRAVSAASLGRWFGVPSAAGPAEFKNASADPKELEDEIERLNVAKGEAVANMDFKLAAKLRDQADELKRRRNR